MKSLSVAVRTDASARIGTGHVMRCLTLAAALQRRGARVCFLSRAHRGHINREIRKHCIELLELPAVPGAEAMQTDIEEDGDEHRAWLGVEPEKDAEECLGMLGEEQPDWLVVDHYALDRTWETQLRSRVGKILAIDDLADRSHDCDLLLDQGFVPEPWRRYDELVPPHCTRLLGPGYALLREEFAAARRDLSRRDGKVRRLFVFFGGSDAADMTGRALEALRHPALDGLQADVVVGPSNPNLETLRERASDRKGVRLHTGVENMAELMRSADLALGAGGTTTWERLCLGLPSLVVTVARNQEASIDALHREGVVTWLGNHADVTAGDFREALLAAMKDPAANRERQRRSMELVRGDGTTRVADVVMHGIPPDAWRLRVARAEDCAVYFDWASDRETRSNAFQPAAISWEDHQRWFHARLADDNAMLLVVEADAGPLGQVRFERSGESYVVSYSLGPQFRRLGLGRLLLARAIQRFRQSIDAPLVAETVAGNEASVRIFERLGFEEVAPRRPESRRFQLSGGIDSDK